MESTGSMKTAVSTEAHHDARQQNAAHPQKPLKESLAGGGTRHAFRPPFLWSEYRSTHLSAPKRQVKVCYSL